MAQFPFIEIRDWTLDLAGEVPRSAQAQAQASQLVERGNQCWLAGDRLLAQQHYEQALQLDSQNPFALCNLGSLAAHQNDHRIAIEFFLRSLSANPTHVESYYNLGNSYRVLRRSDEALECYRRALAIEPKFAEAWTNQGVVWLDRCELHEAERSFRRALEVDPNSPMASNGLGLTLMHLAQYVESRQCIEHALALSPNLPEAHYNFGLLSLLEGDYQAGWRGYEYRWCLPDAPPRAMEVPQWHGESLAGKRLIVHTEQGIGDAIQFVRFLPQLKQAGATIVLECPQRYAKLLNTVHGVDEVVYRGQPLPAADFHIPLLSLGQVLVRCESDIPNEVPYLCAESPRVSELTREIQAFNGLRVGFAWRGSPGFRWDGLRSMPLAAFEPLSRIPGVSLISLQKGPGTEELKECAFRIIDLGSRIDNGPDAMLDTAAAMMELDLVISVDSSLAHLAGSLGRPVWVLLPISPDWRWRTAGESSTWYPTARLFRQPTAGDWTQVIRDVERSLESLARR